MLPETVAIPSADGSPSMTLEVTPDALILPRAWCGAAYLESLTTPENKCANMGRCNAGPVASNRVRQEKVLVDLSEYERCNAPVIWPAALNEDTGRVQKAWADEMFKIRADFWKPLGALLLWRWTQYSTT